MLKRRVAIQDAFSKDIVRIHILLPTCCCHWLEKPLPVLDEVARSVWEVGKQRCRKARVGVEEGMRQNVLMYAWPTMRRSPFVIIDDETLETDPTHRLDLDLPRHRPSDALLRVEIEEVVAFQVLRDALAAGWSMIVRLILAMVEARHANASLATVDNLVSNRLDLGAYSLVALSVQSRNGGIDRRQSHL